MADVDGDEDAKNCKVVLLGESGVGKTSIISRFINDAFEEGCVSTTGASYVSKDLVFKDYKNQLVKFEIWDTAGQEKYRSLTQIFYKDASIAILVYDITSEESFEEVQNYWYKQLKECAPKNIVIGLAANKSDLFENEQVPEEKARNFAQEIGAIFRLTSAYTSVGVEELFIGVGCKFLDPKYRDDGTKKPEVKAVEEDQNQGNEPKLEPERQNHHGSIRLNPNAKNKPKKKSCC